MCRLTGSCHASQHGAFSDIGDDNKTGIEGGRLGGKQVGDIDGGIEGGTSVNKEARESEGESNNGRSVGENNGAGDAGHNGGCNGGKEAGEGGAKDAHNETFTEGDKDASCVGASSGCRHKASKESLTDGGCIGGGGGPFTTFSCDIDFTSFTAASHMEAGSDGTCVGAGGGCISTKASNASLVRCCSQTGDVDDIASAGAATSCSKDSNDMTLGLATSICSS